MIPDMPKTVEGLRAMVRQLLEVDQPFKAEWIRERHGLFYFIILDDIDLLMAREDAIGRYADYMRIRISLIEPQPAAPE